MKVVFLVVASMRGENMKDRNLHRKRLCSVDITNFYGIVYTSFSQGKRGIVNLKDFKDKYNTTLKHFCDIISDIFKSRTECMKRK